MKIPRLLRWKSLVRLALPALAITLAHPAHASVFGPYTTDADTLHLWHLDELAAPSVDAAPGTGTNLINLANGATLGTSSFSGFGTALNTIDGGQDNIAATARDAYYTPSVGNPNTSLTPFTYANSTTGAFTYEALVWIGFDPAKNFGTTADGGNNRNAPFQIMASEGGSGQRLFQFRIVQAGFRPGGAGNPTVTPVPLLTFENIRNVVASQPTIYAAIPTTGPDAILSNNWYHVAVSYNGVPNTANNIKFFWTLLDPSRFVANQIPITSAQNTCNGPNPFASSPTAGFEIGNQARNNNGNFVGYIDEVRMSGAGRKATEMMFYSTNPVVVTPPAGQTVAVGDSASFSVLSAGLPTLHYQWRHEGTNISGATTDSFSVSPAQLADGGFYDVVITNSYGSTTSTVAQLTVRLPLNLTWIGSAGAIWSTDLINWDTNSDGTADTVFVQRDNVTFNAAGSAVPVVLITNNVSPRAIIVNASTDYTLTTTNGAGITGTSSLLQSGTGTLIVDTDNTFIGPTTIQNGILQIGNAGTRGSLGNGPVTNAAALIVNRTGSINFNNFLVGSGSLTNLATNSITINGTNLLSGPIALNAGALILANAQAKGSSTEYVLNAMANASGPTRLTVGGGVTFGPGTTISLLGTTASPDYRCSLTTSDSTNVFNCSIVLDGSGIVQFSSDGAAASSLFRVTTPLINSPAFTGQLILRGNGNGILTSQLNLGGKVSKTDGGIWIINSTGNTWVATDVAGGTLRMGANNVFPNSVTVNITTGGAVLDLAGFDQTVGTFTGIGIVGNSSTSSDSTLTVNPPGLSLFNGAIQNSVAGGTRKVGLAVTGGTQTLGGTNTYTGNTTIYAPGNLQLFVQGSISNSANVFIATGATLDASLRTDGTFTLNPGQTLKAFGPPQFPVNTATVGGYLVNNGTIEMQLRKNGAVLANDLITASTITYGGTLKLNIDAVTALTASDSFVLFIAGGYSGSFTDIIPGPGFGLAWDTTTLATDGTLRITTSTVPATGTNITVTVTGSQMELSWPTNYIGWRLQAQTNSLTVGINTNWVDVAGSTTTNDVFMPINRANGAVFYRMIYP